MFMNCLLSSQRSFGTFISLSPIDSWTHVSTRNQVQSSLQGWLSQFWNAWYTPGTSSWTQTMNLDCSTQWRGVTFSLTTSLSVSSLNQSSLAWFVVSTHHSSLCCHWVSDFRFRTFAPRLPSLPSFFPILTPHCGWLTRHRFCSDYGYLWLNRWHSYSGGLAIWDPLLCRQPWSRWEHAPDTLAQC